MTEAVVRTFKRLFYDIPAASVDIWPATDYKRHAPHSAKELMKHNWQKTGRSLQKAIDKMRDESGRKP